MAKNEMVQVCQKMAKITPMEIKNPTKVLNMGQDLTNHTFGLPPHHRLQL